MIVRFVGNDEILCLLNVYDCLYDVSRVCTTDVDTAFAFVGVWPCSFLPFADGGGGADERSFSVPGGDDLPPDGPLRLPADVRDLLSGVGSALALPPLPGGENCLF